MPTKNLTPNIGTASEPSPQEVNRLIALYKQGLYAESGALANKITKRFPLCSFGWKAMGNTLLQQGRYEEALAPLQKAVELSQGDAQLHNSLGNTLAKLGRLCEAEASYWQAIMLDPGFAEAQHNLGSILKLGRLSETERVSLGYPQNQLFANFEKFSKYVFIVGAQKAGTTSLYSYLAQRPEVASGEIKEKCFFCLDTLYEKGNDFYRSIFPIASKYACAIDATPEYLYYSECASRIHSFDKNAKIIVILREPVSRALSAFNMYHQLVRKKSFKEAFEYDNNRTRDFFMPIIEGHVEPTLDYFLNRELQIMNEGISIEEPSLIRRGLYAPQLERYTRLFGQENILILFSSDLKTDTHNTVNKVCNFIGLKPFAHREYPMKYALKYTVDQSGKELISKLAGDLFENDKLELAKTYDLNVPW